LFKRCGDADVCGRIAKSSEAVDKGAFVDNTISVCLEEYIPLWRSWVFCSHYSKGVIFLWDIDDICIILVSLMEDFFGILGIELSLKASGGEADGICGTECCEASNCELFHFGFLLGLSLFFNSD
jgi:hypothetical protein